MNKKFLVISLLLLLSTSIFFVSNIHAQADSPSVSCPVTISNSILNIKVSFYESLEAQLESPELTSDRIIDLFQDYQQVRTDMKRYANRVPASNNDDPKVISARIANCQIIVRSQFAEINDVFDQYLSQTAISKRNYILIEKYDSLNEKLDQVHDNIVKLDSALSTFNNQLLCFVPFCL